MIVGGNILRSIYLSTKMIKKTSESGRKRVFRMTNHCIPEYREMRLGEC